MPEEKGEAIFPLEAVCEIFHSEEWHEVKPGTFKEFVADGRYYAEYIDSDGSVVFMLDHLIAGWRVDSKLVVLMPEDTEPMKELD